MSDTWNMSVGMVQATALASRDNPAVQGMQMQLTPYQVRSNIPLFGLHGIVSRPMPGAQVIVLFQGGEGGNAVGIAVNDPRYYTEGLPDGTVGLAHHLGASILLYADRIEIQANGKPIVIKNASMTRIEGPLQATGEVTALCDAAAVDLSKHTHADAQGGSVGLPKG